MIRTETLVTNQIDKFSFFLYDEDGKIECIVEGPLDAIVKHRTKRTVVCYKNRRIHAFQVKQEWQTLTPANFALFYILAERPTKIALLEELSSETDENPETDAADEV